MAVCEKCNKIFGAPVAIGICPNCCRPLSVSSAEADLLAAGAELRVILHDIYYETDDRITGARIETAFAKWDKAIKDLSNTL